jgi:hypothetical protein
MKNWLIKIFIVTALTSCQQAKDKGKELVEKSADKTKKELSNLLGWAFDNVCNYSKSKKTTFQEAFGNQDSLKVKNIDGLWVDFSFGFYSCFLKYKADKMTILNFISNQYTSLPDISDQSYLKTDSTEINITLRFIESEYPDIKKKLGFFYEIRQLSKLEYYQCSKYPNDHLIVFDPATATIYHHYENYRE